MAESGGVQALPQEVENVQFHVFGYGRGTREECLMVRYPYRHNVIQSVYAADLRKKRIVKGPLRRVGVIRRAWQGELKQ